MNKQKLIKEYTEFLKRHHLQPTDMIVGAGGVLVLLGLREHTVDIDADVPLDVFNRFLNGGFPTNKIGEHVIVEVGEYVDMHMRVNDDPVMFTDGVCHYTPEVTLAFKRRLNRPKDQSDIASLERYLAV